MNQKVTVLYLETLSHHDQLVAMVRDDQIEFREPVRVDMLRIPKPTRSMYGRLVSQTQSEPIKTFDVYYRNLQGETKVGKNSRFILLTSNNELLASSADDILITPREAIYTDFIVVRGCFSKVTLCLYGSIISPDQRYSKCPFWNADYPLPQSFYKPLEVEMENKRNLRDVFSEQSKEIELIQSQQSNVGLEFMDPWYEVVADDQAHEGEMQNIKNNSSTLLANFTPQNLKVPNFIVDFRSQIEEIALHLNKRFKSKHLGLFYPSGHPSNQIPLVLTELALKSLSLSYSDQFRVLEILRLVLQFKKHAQKCQQQNGILILIKIFVNFFAPDSVVLSSFKTLIIEVLIVLAHWDFAARKMTELLQDDFYLCLLKDQKAEEPPQNGKGEKQKQVKLEHSRSRDKNKSYKKKHKESEEDSENQSDSRRHKKGRKERKSKRDKKTKRDKREKAKKAESLVDQGVEEYSESGKSDPRSFYEICFYLLEKETNSKIALLLKVLAEQILQTLTHNTDVSNQLAPMTPFLRDTKYLFAQTGEIINNRTLKTFATFQPFLNDIQSQGVTSPFVSEFEKVKLLSLEKLQSLKVLIQININLYSSSMKEQQEEYKTPFVESFVTMLSYLCSITKLEKINVFSGFNRIVSTFKVQSISMLKKCEGVLSIISQYIYRVLMEDDGFETVKYMDVIYPTLLRIAGLVAEDPSNFSKELKVRIKFLKNYAMAYDNFNGQDGVFKNFCDYFLKLFKYEHFQISKLRDFTQRECPRLRHPFLFQHLNATFMLGNFEQLYENQPLVQIDVCLKIFYVIAAYNRNIWTLFYEYRLISGFTLLFGKIASLVIFLLNGDITSANLGRYSTLLHSKNFCTLIDNYLSVLKHVLLLITKKTEYEVAFNDLMQEDTFQTCQVYQKSMDLYITLYSALYSQESFIPRHGGKTPDNIKELRQSLTKHQQKVLEILQFIVQIFANMLDAYELIDHKSREIKIKQVLQGLYLRHYKHINQRAAVLALLTHLFRMAEGVALKYLFKYFTEQTLSLDTFEELRVGYYPHNQLKNLQNIINCNIYRSDPLVLRNFTLLLKAVANKQPSNERLSGFFEAIIIDLEEGIRTDDENISGKFLLYKKTNLFSKFIFQCDCRLSPKFDQKLFKLFRIVCARCQSQEKEEELQMILRAKTYLMKYYTQYFRDTYQSCFFLPYLKLIKNLYEGFYSYASTLELTASRLRLEQCNTALECFIEACRHAYYQSVFLYGEYIETPYKIDNEVGFTQVVSSLAKVQFAKYFQDTAISLNTSPNHLKAQMQKVVINLSYLLVRLTTIDGGDFYSTDSRKNSMIALMFEDRQGLFSFLQQFATIIPSEIITIIKDYFSFPIVQKPITLTAKPKPQFHPNFMYKKYKSAAFTKYVFSMIGEGQPVSKARFPFIAGDFFAGDIKNQNPKVSGKGVYCPFRKRNYQEEVNYTIYSEMIYRKGVQYQQNTQFKIKYECLKKPVNPQRLFILNANKNRQGRVSDSRKPCEVVIRLKSLPKQIQQAIKKNHHPPHITKPAPQLTKAPSKSISPSPNRPTPEVHRSISPIKTSLSGNYEPKIPLKSQPQYSPGKATYGQPNVNRGVTPQPPRSYNPIPPPDLYEFNSNRHYSPSFQNNTNNQTSYYSSQKVPTDVGNYYNSSYYNQPEYHSYGYGQPMGHGMHGSQAYMRQGTQGMHEFQGTSQRQAGYGRQAQVLHDRSSHERHEGYGGGYGGQNPSQYYQNYYSNVPGKPTNIHMMGHPTSNYYNGQSDEKNAYIEARDIIERLENGSIPMESQKFWKDRLNAIFRMYERVHEQIRIDMVQRH